MDERERVFAEFAKSCGLAWYPWPCGERYLNRLDGTTMCKKSEHDGAIDELWNALVRAKGAACFLQESA